MRRADYADAFMGIRWIDVWDTGKKGGREEGEGGE